MHKTTSGNKNTVYIYLKKLYKMDSFYIIYIKNL